MSDNTQVNKPDISSARPAQTSRDTHARFQVSILFQVNENMAPSHMAIQLSKNKIINVRFKTMAPAANL